MDADGLAHRANAPTPRRESPPTARLDDGSAAPPGRGPLVVQVALLAALLALTLPFAIYAIARMASPASIEYNEGWNTYHTARLLAGEPLYTPVRPMLPIIPVNYPPTSFFVTAALAPAFGSILLAGRVISLAAWLTIGALLVAIVHRETRQWLAALGAALLWVALLAHMANEWAASHEPQLLGHVLSVLALYLYVCWRPTVTPWRAVMLALLCVLGLTVKHILLPVPLTLALMLLFTNRRAFGAFAATGIAASAAFLAAWWAWTAGVFVSNVIDFDRQGSFARAGREVDNLFRRDMLWPILLPALSVPWRATHWSWALLYLVISLGLGVYWSQGTGVSRNGWFDLFIAASIVFGLLLGSLRSLTGARRWLAYASAVLILLPFAYNTWYDGGDVLDYAALRSGGEAYRQDVALLRSLDGPALYEDLLLGYDAGKDFLVDPFLATQLMLAGRLPEAALLDPIRHQDFKVIVLNADLQRRLRALAAAPSSGGPPQTTAAERWTDNTLRAILDGYELLDTGRRSHYFYVPRHGVAASRASG